MKFKAATSKIFSVFKRKSKDSEDSLTAKNSDDSPTPYAPIPGVEARAQAKMRFEVGHADAQTAPILLFKYVKENNLEALQRLFARDDIKTILPSVNLIQDGLTPFQIAVQDKTHKNDDMIRFLVQHGAVDEHGRGIDINPRQTSTVAETVEPEKVRIEKLRVAVIYNRVEEVENLLNTDPGLINKLDATGHSPLHNAILQNELGMIKLLLGRGADPNQRVDKPDNPMVHGQTPLHCAITGMRLGESFQVNYTPERLETCSEIVEILVNNPGNKADIQQKNAKGETFMDSLNNKIITPEDKIAPNSIKDSRGLVTKLNELTEKFAEQLQVETQTRRRM